MIIHIKQWQISQQYIKKLQLASVFKCSLHCKGALGRNKTKHGPAVFCHFGLQQGVFPYHRYDAPELILFPCMFHSSPQRFPTLNPGGSGCLLVYSEWASLPVLLHPSPPRPPAHTAERNGSTERRVLGQRAETARGGVWPGRWDGRPASQLMS